jgi:type I restriction enzyme S subunit
LLGSTHAGKVVSIKYRFTAQDVLFGRLRAYLRKYWLADHDGVCTTEIWPLHVNAATADPAFVHALVQTEWFIEAACISYGTHMPRSDWSVIKNLSASVPEKAEQNAIGRVLQDMDEAVRRLTRRRDKATAIKQGMMQALLTGRVRLPVASECTPLLPEPVAQTEPSKAHNWQINEAVVIGVLAKAFGSDSFPLGRKRYTKLSYLLHRHAEKQADGYLKKAAGPYNPSTKYGGPEKIALKNRYVREHESGQYKGFVAGDGIAQAEGYFEKWYGPEALKWLEQFRKRKNDALGVLATVDMAAQELRAAGREVTVPAIKAVLAADKEWKQKLTQPEFSDRNIAAAIEESARLFGVGVVEAQA